jgi:hypothetical protein
MKTSTLALVSSFKTSLPPLIDGAACPALLFGQPLILYKRFEARFTKCVETFGRKPIKLSQ